MSLALQKIGSSIFFKEKQKGHSTFLQGGKERIKKEATEKE
jgi:hypothetical protein